MVLDAERVFADQAVAEATSATERGGIGEAEEGGFADALEAGIRRDFDEHPVVRDVGIDTLDLHFASSGVDE